MARGRGRRAMRGSSRRVGNRGHISKQRSQHRVDPRDEVPDVFADMLVEAGPSKLPQEESRPLKRPRLGTGPSSLAVRQTQPTIEDKKTTDSLSASLDSLFSSSEDLPLQTVIDESDDSEESEVEWEQVELDADPTESLVETMEEGNKQESISITLGTVDNVTQRAKRVTKRPLSTAEKKLRLEVHKIHTLCLITHVSKRNYLCNDSQAQAILKRLVPPRLITQLNVDPKYSQLQRTRAFMESLKQVTQLWSQKFKITSAGLRRPRWLSSIEALRDFKLADNVDDPIDRTEFRQAAKTMEGSVDLGAQLLCCLLRSVSVEARLVCSLQALSFGATKNGVPSVALPKNEKSTVYLHDSEDDSTADERANEASENTSRSPSHLNRPSSTLPSSLRGAGRISQLSLNNTSPSVHAHTVTSTRRTVRRPAHPIYWVEVFNLAYQKWISLDALCTQSVNKPSKIEPPLNDSTNILSYAIAFNEDGTAKDVTRRYARAFNAKTRKQRIESTEGGVRWWERVMRMYQYPDARGGRKSDADTIEDAELLQREQREGMPNSIQDFKNHPIYALERHLRLNEVIWPRHEVGKVNAGSNAKPRMESVFRRNDVHVVRSADKWFRLGREIKCGEEPLKYVVPTRRTRQRERSVEDGDGVKDNDLFGESETGTGLYAAFQTEPYVPPAVVRGKVPKNAYGNLDIYVPSMVPSGGVHVRHPDAKFAAKIVGVDYADAVVGFKFQGRRGTAVVQGIIVAVEFQEAVEAVVEGLRCEREGDLDTKKTLEMLRLWRRFLVGLRILDRVKQYNDDGEEQEQEDIRNEMDEEMERFEQDEFAGGFFPEDNVPVVEPTTNRGYATNNNHNGGFSGKNWDLFDFGNVQVPEKFDPVVDRIFINELVMDQGPRNAPDHDGIGGRSAAEEYLEFKTRKADFTPMLTTDYEHAEASNCQEPVEDVDNKQDQTRDALEDFKTFERQSSPHDMEPRASQNCQPLGRTIAESSKSDSSQSSSLNGREPAETGNDQNSVDELRSDTKVDDDDEYDRSSLPSHDPDDEDADPDWLL